MRVKFEIRKHRSAPFEKELILDIITIGREGCDINIDDKLASRQHAVIYLSSRERLMIKDLGSLNGLRKNGKKYRELSIQTGTEFGIGSTKIKIVYADPKEVPGEIVRSVLEGESSDVKTEPGLVVDGPEKFFSSLPKDQQEKFTGYNARNKKDK